MTLSLERLVERSSGVFGKSGTGKTFLSRLLLAGIIRDRVAVNLIFDMHNEYGWEGSSEGASKRVKGLKQIFPDGRVKIFTLDDESSRRRGSNPDYTVTIGYEQVEPEDLEMLQGILNLSEPQVGAIYALRRRLGPQWLVNFLDDDWIDSQGEFDPESGKAKNGLKALADDMGQTVPDAGRAAPPLRSLPQVRLPPGQGASTTRSTASCKHLDANTNIVLEFGRYGNMLDAYIFVANFLTRRLHQKYVREEGERLRQQGGRAYAAGDHHRGGAQVPRSADRRPHHLRHDCARAAQVQRHPLHRRPAAQPDRPRGDEPDRHAGSRRCWTRRTTSAPC